MAGPPGGLIRDEYIHTGGGSTAYHPPAMRLDELMPAWDVHEVHGITVRAPPEGVDRALREVRADEIRLFSFLMTLRGLRPSPRHAGRPLLAAAQDGGFAVLSDQPGRELVLGVIGRFWRLRDRDIVPIESAAHFTGFARPGFARAATNFRLETMGAGACRLTTETRVATTDARARRAFRVYWTLIQPGSALIRRLWLRAIRRRAESQK